MTPLSSTELRLAQDPDDEIAWSLYAGELHAAGDARAPLLARELSAGGEEGATRQLVEAQPAAWLNLPSYAIGDPDPGLWFDWKHGFVTGLVVDLRPGLLKWPPLVEQLGRFLDSPAARLLRRVELRRVERDTEPEHTAKLTERPRPALRELTLRAGPLAGGAVPGLESLVLRDPTSLERLSLPGLRHLTLHAAELSATALRNLSESALPALETLRLSLGAGDTLKPKHRPGAAHVAAVLDAFDHLRELSIHGVPYGDELLERLVDTAAAASVEVLDLRRVDLTARGLAALRAGAPKLPRLCALFLDPGALGSNLTAALGPLAEKYIVSVPTPVDVARHALAMLAECGAWTLEQTPTQESHRTAVRRRAWASLWLFDELEAIGDHATAWGIGALLWALGMSEDPEQPLTAALVSRVPVEQPTGAFLKAARLRSRPQLEAMRRTLEDKLWSGWQAFDDVSELREQVRALRWLLGVARDWRDVPVHLARHALPAPEAADAAVLERLDRAWKNLRRHHRQPLPGPVSADKLDLVEREIGARFAPDLRASLLLHGGGSYPAIRLISLESALARWREIDRSTAWAEAPRPRAATADTSLAAVKTGAFRRGWFPVTSSEIDSDFYAADLDPAPGGTAGQVLFWSHEIPGPECVMHPSFVEWLEWTESTEQLQPLDP